MTRPIPNFARALTELSVARPRAILTLWAVIVVVLGWRGAQLPSEVGYAAYFGPRDPAVERLESFLEEFDSGLHVLVAFRCPGGASCTSFREEAALQQIGRMQAAIDSLPDVLRTRSVLNTPIVTGPLDTRTIAKRSAGGYELAPDWAPLITQSAGEPFLAELVISKDLATAGIVVELRSLDSARVREFVHGLMKLKPGFEADVGSEVFIAGDPVWTVLSDDDLDADSRNLTVMMFIVIAALLWGFLREIRLVVLPLIAVAALAISVQGLIALFGFPMTTILAALPPLLVVISVLVSIHFLTAYLRHQAPSPAEAMRRAAAEVGLPCQWGALTTAAGFASFTSADLASFRQFGAISAVGLLLGFVTTFSLLPALMRVAARMERAQRRLPGVGFVLETALQVVSSRPAFVLATGAVVIAVLIAGIPRLYYEVDFGDQSLVLRSVRFMQANFRRPMTTEIVVTIPDGRRIYDAETLRLLDRIERHFESEPSTGQVWSFLDFLGEAHRVNHGTRADSLDGLIASARADMPIVASFDGLASFWAEHDDSTASGETRDPDRARISVHRSWLDGDEQIPYVDRVEMYLTSLNQELSETGYRVELKGGLPLAALAERRIREAQWGSFGLSFLVVAGVLVVLLRRQPTLAALAVGANVLPVLALLGLMGWAGIAVDPANSMVAAILLAVADDDTIHMTTRYAERRTAGFAPKDALASAFESTGEAIVVATVCLSLGFAVLMFSRWAGLVSFGLLASLGILMSLVADVILLPAALLVLSRKQAPAA